MALLQRRQRKRTDWATRGRWPAATTAPRGYRVAKRLLDLVGSGVLVAAFAPAWVAIAVAIKATSPGPMLFRQQRLGENGRVFTLYKFRTMHVNNDDTVHRRFIEAFMTTDGASGDQTGWQYYKLRDDPRVTPIGRMLRKTSLDEVPQLLNVLRGEMSLVGPRPPLPYEVERYQPWQLGRLRTRPGITGYWQVYGRSRVPFEEMVRMDLEYIARASIWLDLKLLLLTIPAVLSGAGAE